MMDEAQIAINHPLCNHIFTGSRLSVYVEVYVHPPRDDGTIAINHRASYSIHGFRGYSFIMATSQVYCVPYSDTPDAGNDHLDWLNRMRDGCRYVAIGDSVEASIVLPPLHMASVEVSGPIDSYTFIVTPIGTFDPNVNAEVEKEIRKLFDFTQNLSSDNPHLHVRYTAFEFQRLDSNRSECDWIRT